MKKLLLISALILTNLLLAQEKDKTMVWGLVLDTNNNPVVNANVLIVNTNTGTTTDKDGFFFIPLKKSNIKISHINYFSETILINQQNRIVNDTIKVNVFLKSKINLIDSFVVSSKKTKLLYNKPYVTIHDFQFYEDNLLLLLDEDNVTKLQLVNDQASLLQELKTPQKSKKMYKDCFNNIHIVGEDSVYQVYSNASLSLPYVYSHQEFESQLEPYIIHLNNNLVFNLFGLHNQSVAYFYTNKQKEKKSLKQITNKATTRFATATVVEIKELKEILRRRSLGAVTYDERPSYIIARLISQLTGFYDKVLTKPMSAPLLKINNQAFLFDHTNDSCFVYDENLQLNRSFYIDYHHKKGWKKELIADQEQGAVYAQFEKGGLCYLKKIDLTTGKITDSYKLEKHIFPSNIKIRNNTAYYLYKDIFNHGQISLYQQQLY